MAHTARIESEIRVEDEEENEDEEPRIKDDVFNLPGNVRTCRPQLDSYFECDASIYSRKSWRRSKRVRGCRCFLSTIVLKNVSNFRFTITVIVKVKVVEICCGCHATKTTFVRSRLSLLSLFSFLLEPMALLITSRAFMTLIWSPKPFEPWPNWACEINLHQCTDRTTANTSLGGTSLSRARSLHTNMSMLSQYSTYTQNFMTNKRRDKYFAVEFCRWGDVVWSQRSESVSIKLLNNFQAWFV